MARFVTLDTDEATLPVLDCANTTGRQVNLGGVSADAARVVFDAVMDAIKYLNSKTGLRTGTPIGFSLADEGFGSSLAYQYREKAWLSDKQFAAAQRLCWKYRRQLRQDAGMDPEMIVGLKYPRTEQEPETSAFKIKVRGVHCSDQAVKVRFLEPTKYGNMEVWLPRKNVVKDTLGPLLSSLVVADEAVDIYIVGWFAKKLGLVK